MAHKYTEHIEHSDEVHIFYVGFDMLDNGMGQVSTDFANELFNDIPEFAFGPTIYTKKLDAGGPVELLREALKKIYEIPEIKEAQVEYLNSTNTEEKYIKRGEFGELILYHLLHEYFNADALISKIYFKDSAGLPAHGFDAVHVDLDKETLWLGESKMYSCGSSAINALIKDVEGHFRTEFFKSEFQIISNRVHDVDNTYPEFIKKLIDPNTKTLEKLANINIALFAAFNSQSINDGTDNLEERIKLEVIQLINKMNKGIESHAWSDKMNIYLFLFPLDNKRQFVSMLHQKLKGAQQL